MRDTGIGLTSRRTFLSAATAFGAATVAGGLWPLRHTVAAQGIGPAWHLEAVRVEQTFAEGSTVPFFRFRPLGSTPSNGALPILIGEEGSLATLTVENRLDFPIQPELIGFDRGTVVPPGETVQMPLVVPPPGTWLMSEATLGTVAGTVGFGAVIVSRRAAPPVLSASKRPAQHPFTKFDREYVLVYQDADDRWNLAVDSGAPPDTSVYEPNFHTVNGLSFPDLASNPDSRVVCALGERVLIRLANLGLVRHVVHFHGYHVMIKARDSVRDTMHGPKDSIPLPAHSTTDVLLPVDQTGVFPIHPHSLTTVTDNGTYPHGQITLIEAS